MTSTPDDQRRLESTESRYAQPFDPHDTIEAIVKVNEDNYVPSTVKLRSRVDATMFTCELSAGALEQIETDPKVISVSPSKKIRMID